MAAYTSSTIFGAPKSGKFIQGDTFVDAEGRTFECNQSGYPGKWAPVSAKAPNETLAAATTLTAEESGKVMFLNHATEFAVTLPSPEAGLRFTFIVTGAPVGANYTVVTSGGSNIVKGHIVTTDVNSATDPDLETSGADTISFVASKAVAGDKVEVVCDGTNWFAYGSCTVFDAITITTAA